MTTVTMPRRAWVEQVMGLPVSIHLRGAAVRDPGVAHAVAATFAELRTIDALFSTYRTDSEVSRVNSGQLALADAHPMLREIAELCELARDRTDGGFDARLPGPRGGTWWDPSGVVKGWATERAARSLAAVAALAGHDVSVNAGGDIAVSSGRRDSTAWRIGVEDPERPGQLLLVVPLRHGGVATSGTAARGLHIHDPRTGRPAQALRAATVVGPSLLWADVYATAAMVLGTGAQAWLEGIPAYDGVLVTAEGRVTATSGLTGSAPRRPEVLAADR
jgi:thiamine biosynthesis lipoprotein